MTEQPTYPLRVASAWIHELAAALAGADETRLAALFLPDSYWRDLVAFTGDIGWVGGADAIVARMIAAHASSAWRVSERHSPPRVVQRVGREVVEAFIEFETTTGPGSGVLRLDVQDEPRAWVLLTRLDDYGDSPKLRPRPRPAGVGYDPAERRNWLDRRAEALDYSTRDPDVLVVGGGHSGLFAAAHLGRLGVDTLVVDRLERVGENWRERYHSLALHNSSDMVQFPYLPFPDTYPEYLPKDQLATWFEVYVDAMEINYWTSTVFVGGSYDEVSRRWHVWLEREGAQVELRPRHLVLATGGVGGAPSIPKLPGLQDFAGEVVHTKDFASGADYAAKRVLVVGVGSSGHDAAFDLHRSGAQVTMLQRNPTSVVNLDSANLSYRYYNDGTPIDEADLLSAAGFIHPLLIESLRSLTTITNERDRELLEGLRAAGLRLDDGEQGAGWGLKFFERGGGYYFNVGASELIVDGSIGVLQASEVSEFTPEGVRLNDGSTLRLDAVVLATGYLNQQAEIRQYFGDEVADRVGVVSGFGEDGELRNAWRRTAQPGLWIMVSGFSAARIHSPLVAMQIRGDLDAG